MGDDEFEGPRASGLRLAAVLLLVLALPGAVAAQVDMTGTWKVRLSPDLFSSSPELWQFSQSGTSLVLDAPLIDDSGTIDPLTGDFEFVGEAGSGPFCADVFGVLGGRAALDGLSFTGHWGSPQNTPTRCVLFGPALRAVRCLNAPLDPSECLTPSVTIPASKLVFRDVAGQPNRRRILFLARDAGFAPVAESTSGDPLALGATLIVARGAAETAVLSLPAAGWDPLPNGGGYRYRDPAGTFGPCRSALWRERVLKVVCRGSDIPFTLDEPSQGALAVTFQPGLGVRACAEFGGVEVDRPAAPGRAGLFRARNAAAPGACTPAVVP